MNTVLGVRLGRRLMAAASFEDDQFVFHDSRYVSSRKSTLDTALPRYFSQLFDQLKPSTVYYYAPTGTQTVTEHLATQLELAAAQAGVPVTRLSKTDLFDGFGMTPLRTRRELREQLTTLWPVIGESQPGRQTVVAEAAVAALVGDLRRDLPPT